MKAEKPFIIQVGGYPIRFHSGLNDRRVYSLVPAGEASLFRSYFAAYRVALQNGLLPVSFSIQRLRKSKKPRITKSKLP